MSEAQRMLQSGEVKSLDEAIQKLRNAGGYYDVFGVLDRTGRGKDTMAYIKTVANPALTDAQVSGETLRLAEKLLDREDFEFASHVSSLLTGDAYVGPQAKELVKTRIPDEAKWAAKKAAIWKAVKDILIVPAIIEGRYGDAFVSALTTIASFGVGRIFSAGAKIAWAGFTARSVAKAGWMARFAAWSPRGFRVAEVGAVAMADNAGFAVGGMMMETAKTGQNQFGWHRFWHEMLIGIAPFGLVHASGKVMGAIGKRAEHIPWLKVATEAEVTLLKGQGKLAISQGGRAAVWTTHRLMNASAFTLGGMINQNLGFIEKDNAPLGLVFLQNLAMDFQMMAAHKGVNALTGGRMDKLDRKLDQELYLAPTLAKLKIPPKSAAGKAMTGFLLHYSDAMAGKRGKPLSGDELMKEVSALNESVMPLLKKNGLDKGDAFEAARAQIFIHAARKNLSADHMKWYAERMKIPAEMDRMASDLLPGEAYSKEVRDSMKGELLSWAMDRAGHPDNVQENLKKLADLSGEMGKHLDQAVESLMGPGSAKTPQGMRLRELLLGRALGAAEQPSDAARLLEGMAKQAPSLGKAMGELVSGLDPKARIAVVEWATERGFDVAAFDHLRNEVKEGKVELKFEDGKLIAARVPEERQAEQKQKYESGLVEDRIRQRGEDAAKLSADLGLDGGFTKSDRDRFGELVQKAAKDSKISMTQAKELFQGLDPVLKRDVDPMHLDGVRRAIFLEVLGGKMGETRAWDLAAKLAKGEIILEVGAFGEFTIQQRPAAEKTADDDAKTQVRQAKADDDAKTQVRKPKADDDTNADTVVELRKRKVSDSADTVVELRNRKAPVDTRKVGVADFKPINEVEAKADKIAKATPSPERVQRYEKYLIEKKKMDPAEAKIQAEAWAKQVIVDARAYQAGRTHIYDTSLPLRPETAHMDAATVDHHGRFANAKNSTEQLIDKMEAVGALVKNDSKALDAAAKDDASMAAARRGLQEAGIRSPSDKQVREVAAALR
ncbi:MAG TPA: hypothetical protein VJP40_07630, partial [bacterium]|nr:hypothetical protein [bacterium]